MKDSPNLRNEEKEGESAAKLTDFFLRVSICEIINFFLSL